MASRPGGDARRQAAVSSAGLDRPAGGGRACGFIDDAGPRRLECQGQNGSRLAAGLSIMAPGICRHRKTIDRAPVCRVSCNLVDARRFGPFIVRDSLALAPPAARSITPASPTAGSDRPLLDTPTIEMLYPNRPTGISGR